MCEQFALIYVASARKNDTMLKKCLLASTQTVFLIDEFLPSSFCSILGTFESDGSLWFCVLHFRIRNTREGIEESLKFLPQLRTTTFNNQRQYRDRQSEANVRPRGKQVEIDHYWS